MNLKISFPSLTNNFSAPTRGSKEIKNDKCLSIQTELLGERFGTIKNEIEILINEIKSEKKLYLA